MIKFSTHSLLIFLNFINAANAVSSVVIYYKNIKCPYQGCEHLDFYDNSGNLTYLVNLRPENPTFAAGLILKNPARAMFKGVDCTPASFAVTDNTELRADVSVDPSSGAATCTVTTLTP